MTNTELGKTRHIRCYRKIRNRPPFLSSLCLISILFYFAESRRARRPLPHLQLPARSAVPCSFFFSKREGSERAESGRLFYEKSFLSRWVI